MELHLSIIGYLLIVLALVHIILPRYFNWKSELATLTMMSRQLLYVHTFFIALTVLLMGIFCVTCTDEIISTPLGRKFSLGLGAFWGIRFLFQHFVYSPTLWRGKRFETAVHILASVFWAYMSVIFLGVYGNS